MSTLDAISVETLHPGQLSAADVDAWRGVQRDNAVFANPLFGPEFAMLVGRTRQDARVAVFRRAGEAQAFLAYHCRPGGFARPIGAPFSDYQGVVCRRDFELTGPEVLAWAGIGALRFAGLIDPEQRFSAKPLAQQAFAIHLDEAPDAYLEKVRAASPKKFKNYRRLEHRLAEQGEMVFVANDRSQAAFDHLMAWKSEQFRQSGLQDVLRPTWVKQMMADLFAGDYGLMCSLYVGGVLAAGHFGIRTGEVYHPWIASTNPDLNAFSPGNAYLAHAIRAMPRLGLTTYDLGPGHDHYKRPFANVERQISAGLTVVDNAMGRYAKIQDELWGLAGLDRIGPVDKIRRRLDQIATVDPSFGGRIGGLVEAVAGVRRRGLGNETASHAVP